jgi:uncharacterized membrane protein
MDATNREIVKVTARNRAEAIAALEMLQEMIRDRYTASEPVDERVIVTCDGDADEYYFHTLDQGGID